MSFREPGRWAELAQRLQAGDAASEDGNGSPTNPGTPKGTYTIKVSGQSGSLTRSVDLTLVVQ